MPALNSVIAGAAEGLTDSELIDYAPATTIVDGQVMWLSIEAVPLLAAIDEQSEDLTSLPLFDPGTESPRDLRLVAMRATDDDGSSAVFVQSLRGNQIVAQSRRVGVIVRRGVLDVPASGDIMLLTKDVAATVIDRYVFFRDRAAFERLFGFLAELQARATATFQSVTANLRIFGLEAMATAVISSPAMLGKMASIQRKLDQYPLYREALTMDNLSTFVEQHPECGVEMAGQGAAAELVFRNDPQHRFKILKLLDDDFLRSELTNLEYEANSKGAPIG
jgi:hypothetical protein